MEKKALLVISFGTSYLETRKKTIGATEDYLKKAYPDHDFFRAFTSRMIISKLKKRDDEKIDLPTEALKKLKEAGYTQVHCQTTHIINGHEYELTRKEVQRFANEFENLTLGRPLLTSVDDYEETVDVLIKQMPTLKKDEALIYMGHGTDHHANATYPCLDYMFKLKGLASVYVATVEGFPELENLLPLLAHYKKIYLAPLMLVAGDHAINDMASDDEESWKSILEDQGFKVECILEGLGEYRGIQKIFLNHLKKAEEMT